MKKKMFVTILAACLLCSACRQNSTVGDTNTEANTQTAETPENTENNVASSTESTADTDKANTDEPILDEDNTDDTTWNVRPTYSLQEINEGKLEGVTFNSIILQDSDYEWYKNAHDGQPIPEGTLRNETNFVGARISGENQGAENVWEGDSIQVEDGETYIIRLYVHNNNPNGEEGAAENTQVRFYVPQTASKDVTVNGWISASNATEENGYVDDVAFTSDTAFHLEYQEGSALLENGNYASGAGVTLTDAIINQGDLSTDVAEEWVKIGYNDLDGIIPGDRKSTRLNSSHR